MTFRGYPILIVDDDLNLRKTLGDILTIRGFTPLTAGTGRAALELLRRQDVAVALVDLRLGDMDGLTLIGMIKSEVPTTECILLTGHASQDSAIQAINRGAYSYIQKPFDIDQLMVTVQRAAEKRAAEMALLRSEAIFRGFLEQSVDAIVLSDQEGRVVVWSQGAERLFGYSREESVGRPLWEILCRSAVAEILTPDTSERLKAAYLHHFTSDDHSAFKRLQEITIQRPDGTRRTIQTLTFQVDTDTDVLVGSISRDMTERKQAEAILQESEERFRSLYENATLGIYRTTPEGHILMANPSLVHMLGYETFDKLYRRNLEQEGYEPGYERNQFRAQIEAEGVIRGFESAWKRRDGTVVYVRESARVVRDEKGQTRYYEGSVEDISEQKQAEIALQESQRQLTTLMSNLPGMAYRCQNDRDWTMMFVSEGCAALTGYQASDLIGNHKVSYNTIIHPDDRRMVWDVIQQKVQERHPYQLGYRIVAADGEEKWVWEQGRGVENEQGGFMVLEGLIVDITAQKHSELERARSETRYRAIFEGVQDAIFVESLEGKILDVNQRACELFGLSRQEFLSKKVSDLVPTGYPLLSQYTAEQGYLPDHPIESMYVRANGEHFPVEINGRLCIVGDETVLLVVSRDITKRKQAENDLRASEERYRMLAENMSDTVWLMGMDLEILYISPSVVRQRGYTLEELNALPLTAQMSPDSQRLVMQTLAAQLTPEHLSRPDLNISVDLELEFYKKDGSTYWSENTFSLLRSEDGKPVGILGFGRDITERRKAEAETRRRLAELEVLYDNGLALARLLDPYQIGQRIVDLLGERLDWHHAALRRCDPQTGRVDLLGFSHARLGQVGVDRERSRVQDAIKTPAQGMTGWVLQYGQALCCDDLSADGRYVSTYPNMASGLYVPILAGERVLGAISVESEHPAAFSASDERLLATLAAQAGAALENARLHNEVVRYADQMRTVNEIGRALAETLELHQIYHRLTEAIYALLPDICAVFISLFDRQKALITCECAQADGSYTDQATLPPIKYAPGGPGRQSHVIQTRQPLIVSDLERKIRAMPEVVEVGRKDRFAQSALYVPLLGQGDVVGVVQVQSYTLDRFHEADVKLLSLVANTAAVAIQNGRLYKETRQRLEELDALVQISAAMRTVLSRAEMLPIILEQVVSVLHAEGAAFASRNDTTGEVFFELTNGKLADLAHYRVPAGQGIVGKVFETGQVYISQDIFHDPQTYVPFLSAVLPKAVAFIPLVTQDHVAGVLLVGAAHELGVDQINLLKTVADIAANAIQRAVLYEQSVRYAAELEQRVTERTSELRAANAALERAARMKDEFLANMSHELRTPLTGVLNLSEALQEQIHGPLNEKQLHYLNTIESSGRHLLGLINDILDLSKIDAGQFYLQIEPCYVSDLCQSSMQLIRPMATRKNQTVSCKMEPAEMQIAVDPRRMKQVLVNLLSNANKFTPDGGHIGLEVMGDAEAQTIRFVVWDTGIGIAEADQSRLFQPFVQLDSGLARQQSGTGLGLALVMRMVDRHGGSVSVESTLGQGSRFTIILPWQRGDPQKEELKPPQALSAVVRGQVGEVKLLLAEDNDINIFLYADFLGTRGYQVHVAHHGVQAVELAHQLKPDLILMDIQMPVMDGLEAIHRIRSSADLQVAQAPIVALTALALVGDRQRCLDAGANEYLSKPVSLRELDATIQALLAPPAPA